MADISTYTNVDGTTYNLRDDGAFREYKITTAGDLDTLLDSGIYHCTVAMTHAPAGLTNHATVIVDGTVGTKYQIFIPDASQRVFKRYRNNSAGTWYDWVEWKVTDTTYTPASATPANIGTAAVGTSVKYAREDHVHAISLATGDANGQVKIAGTNVAVKGLGTAAYTASTAYAAASHNHSAGDINSGTLAVARGGTGQTTENAAANAFIRALEEGTSPAQRGDYIVAQYAGGGTTTTTYHRRKLENVFKALNKSDVTTALGYTPPTENTWRGIQDNLTSSSNTTESLSAKQGYLLANGSARDNTKLPLTGGQISGNVDYKSTVFDASLANNNVSSIVYPTTFDVLDKSSRIMARLEAVVNPNGNIGSYWYIRNYNTSGTNVGQKGISMTMDKTGALTYAVSDPDKFRSAIGISSEFLPLAGGTVTGSLILSRTTDVSGTANNKPALLIGGTDAQKHIEIDNDEIQAKASGTTTSGLWLNNDGGAVYLSNGNKIYANDGGMYATTYKVNDKVTMQWNATDESLDFVFA